MHTTLFSDSIEITVVETFAEWVDLLKQNAGQSIECLMKMVDAYTFEPKVTIKFSSNPKCYLVLVKWTQEK